MNAEQATDFLRQLPHAVETMQWGNNLVYWTGDKAIGGKMFAVINLDEGRAPGKPAPVLSFYVGPERYFELLEVEDVIPAPYMARLYWVALARWNAIRRAELESLLRAANAGVLARLPSKTRNALALPQTERNKLIAAKRKLLKTKTVRS